VNEEALAHWGAAAPKEKNVSSYLAAYSVTPPIHTVVTWLGGRLKCISLINVSDINSQLIHSSIKIKA